MSAQRTIDPKDADAARYRYLVRNRNWNLLKLLADGKGTEEQFDALLDKCIASEVEIRSKQP